MGRKLPANPYFLFCTEVKPTIDAHLPQDKIKKLAEMWGKLSDEEKQKYKDKFEAERKEYMEWANSEEGRKSLEERADVKRKCKAATAELAAANVASEELSKQNEVAHMSPTKVANGASAFEPKEPPVKQRRVASAKTPSNEEPLLDEKIVE